MPSAGSSCLYYWPLSYNRLCSDFLDYSHSVGDRPARPRSGSLSGRDRTRRLKPLQPSISYKLDLATEGSHHSILWEEEKLQTQEENSGSSDDMGEAESEQPAKDEEQEDTTNKPMSEESSPDEDDFFARSSKYEIIIIQAYI